MNITAIKPSIKQHIIRCTPSFLINGDVHALAKHMQDITGQTERAALNAAHMLKGGAHYVTYINIQDINTTMVEERPR